MRKILPVVFVAGVCLLDAGPGEGQMATTTKPYDVTTLEGYREWAIRYAAVFGKAKFLTGNPPTEREPPEGWPAVTEADWPNIQFTWYPDQTPRILSVNQGGPSICAATEILKSSEEDNLPIPPGTCRELRLPPTPDEIGGHIATPNAMSWNNVARHTWYGEWRAEPLIGYYNWEHWFKKDQPLWYWCDSDEWYYQPYHPPCSDRKPTPTPNPQPRPEPATQTPVGRLEIPANGSFQSGIGYVSGWVCEAETVAIVIDGGLHIPPVSRFISRGDTEEECGDQNNGFITQWNWNLMGDGTYTAALVVDGQTLHTNTFTVTTLGEEFVRGAAGECTIADFPSDGESATFRWQEAVQGLVLVPDPTE